MEWWSMMTTSNASMMPLERLASLIRNVCRYGGGHVVVLWNVDGYMVVLWNDDGYVVEVYGSRDNTCAVAA
jgi:hypothetical protein